MSTSALSLSSSFPPLSGASASSASDGTRTISVLTSTMPSSTLSSLGSHTSSLPTHATHAPDDSKRAPTKKEPVRKKKEEPAPKVSKPSEVSDRALVIATIETIFMALILVNALGWGNYITSLEMGASNIALTTLAGGLFLKKISVLTNDPQEQKIAAFVCILLSLGLIGGQIPLIMNLYPSSFVAAALIPALSAALLKSCITNAPRTIST